MIKPNKSIFNNVNSLVIDLILISITVLSILDLKLYNYIFSIHSIPSLPYLNGCLFSIVLFSVSYSFTQAIIPFCYPHRYRLPKKRASRDNIEFFDLIKTIMGMIAIPIMLVIESFIFFFAFSMYNLFDLPQLFKISAVIIFVSFGFFLSIENFNETIALDPNLEKKIRSLSDHTLLNYFPPVVILLALIFPLDIMWNNSEFKNLYLIEVLTLGSLVFFAYKILRVFSLKFMKGFEIEKEDTLKKYIIIFIIGFICCYSLNVWDARITNDYLIGQKTVTEVIGLLFFSGLLVLRGINIFHPSISLKNRFFSLAFVVIYVFDKIVEVKIL